MSILPAHQFIIGDPKTSNGQFTVLEDYLGNPPSGSSGTTISLYCLQSLTEQLKTNVTPYQTLGESTTFFFAEDPRIFNYEAFVLLSNSKGTTRGYIDFQRSMIPGTKIKLEYEGHSNMGISAMTASRTGYILSNVPRLSAAHIGFASVSFMIFCSDSYK